MVCYCLNDNNAWMGTYWKLLLTKPTLCCNYNSIIVLGILDNVLIRTPFVCERQFADTLNS